MSKEGTEEGMSEGENEDEERIYYAIKGEDIVTLKHLLEDGFDPNTKFNGSNQLDKSALHLCCETGNYECAKMLLEWGANINPLDAWNQTPLIYSLSSERSNMVDLLLQFGADPDIKDRFGKTAVHFALGNSDARNLSALAGAGAAVDARDDTGRAALWCAVMEDGHRDHVQRLIHAGADVNARDQREKRTPLQVAILNATHDAVWYVRALLAAGAHCNTVDQFGHSPMMTLIRRNRRKDKQHVQDEDITIANLLIQHSYNVDLVSRGRQWYQFRGSALKMAADRGAVPLVQLLLDAGADPDITDDKNVTPLLVAAANNYVDVAKRLLAMNCRVDVLGERKVERTSVRATPFRCALLKGHVGMARLIVLAGYTLHREPYVWSCCCKPDNKHTHSDDDDERNPARTRTRQREVDSHREGEDDAEEAPAVLQEDGELRAWLEEQVRVPRALAEVARWHIRHLLGKPLRQRLDALPLPRAIKDYVLMKDLLD